MPEMAYRFESCRGHYKPPCDDDHTLALARMAELVDALGSGPSWGNPVEVRVLFRALSSLAKQAHSAVRSARLYGLLRQVR